VQAERTPIFVKTFDFVLWLFPHTAKFPRTLRHTLTNRLEAALLDFQGTILRANRLRGGARLEMLDGADGLLDSVRMLVRLSASFGHLSQGQYEHAAERLTEIGRLLGGWRKATAEGR